MRRVALVLLLLITGCSYFSDSSPKGPPNILFILTDDMRLDDLQFMPNVRSLIADQGMTFDNYFDNVTLCCPARTSILRGQYSHNTGVLTNNPPNGGFNAVYSKKLEQATMATSLHAAGYSTGLFGKYLNRYPGAAGGKYVPPGWDAWATAIKGHPYAEYDYTLNVNGSPVKYGTAPTDYGTDVYFTYAEDFVTRAAREAKPFFTYLAVYAPHGPATPAPGDDGAFADARVPRTPAFNEADVSDKPQYIREEPLHGESDINSFDSRYRMRAQSLLAVDRGVAKIIDTLRANKQLANTYIVFTSDNGFRLGEHRLFPGKNTAYEPDIHLPLLIRGPGVKAKSHVGAHAGNVDLAPTFAELGRTSMLDNPDGRSLVPWLKGKGDDSTWRQSYLLEHWGADSTAPAEGDEGDVEPADEPPSSPGALPRGAIPEFQGFRFASYKYVEYVTGERELYDLSKDPDEVSNLAASADAGLISRLHARLDQMRTCVGDTCRAIESAPFDLPN